MALSQLIFDTKSSLGDLHWDIYKLLAFCLKTNVLEENFVKQKDWVH